MAVKKIVKYSVVDAFTDTPFKRNPAAVCLLEEEERDDEWLRAVAREFNISETCYLTRIVTSHDSGSNCRFGLRWFTPVKEVELCGHATLAAAHVIFTSGLATTNVVEFSTLYGILTAKKVLKEDKSDTSSISNGKAEGFYIELDFPTHTVVECDSSEALSIPLILNGAPVINIKKTSSDDLMVELSSGEAVAKLQPNIDEIHKLSAGGLIITGMAPSGSGFDFFSRFFCPKHNINEDPVCGSVHCALVPYWSKKLGKCDFKAYMASARGGVLDLHWNKETGRILIRGEAVTVMDGSLFA